MTRVWLLAVGDAVVQNFLELDEAKAAGEALTIAHSPWFVSDEFTLEWQWNLDPGAGCRWHLFVFKRGGGWFGTDVSANSCHLTEDVA